MNKLCYRIVFNRARRMLVVVSELARAHGGACGGGSGRRGGSLCARITPLSFALWLASGLVGGAQAAGIVADKGAAGHQQPTVVNAANGLPQVNIQTPNDKGLSHNKFSQFDVDKRGAILNNSSVNTKTQLAGIVAANPWLAKGEAKVILNEVNSRNPSQLNGFVEVAGKKADVIIANPAGITCSGCGFINANRSTLTTGASRIENGQLKGFDVDGGQIRVEGGGMNDQSDYTQLIARSVTVNARLQANNLQVTTGRNQTDVQGNVTRVKADDGRDKPAFALDVAALGGMYAGKIALVGTERGVGVRNAGEIGAGVGEFSLSADGQLTNSGRINGQGTMALAATDINNSGQLRSRGAMKLDASGALTHSGGLLAGGDAQINASRITATRESVTAAGVDEQGKASQAGRLALNASGQVSARGKLLARDRIDVDGAQLDLQGAQAQAGDIALSAKQGDIDTRSAQLAASQRLSAASRGKLNNDGGSLQGERLTLSSSDISNRQGSIAQTGTTTLAIDTGRLDNDGGSLTSAGGMSLRANSLSNLQGQLGAFAGDMHIAAGALNNRQGKVILQGDGALDISATTLSGDSGTVVSDGALRIAALTLTLNNAWTQGKQVEITGDSLAHRGATLLQSGNGQARLILRGGLDNTDGKLISQGGFTLSGTTLNNQQGTVNSAAGPLSLTFSDKVDNAGGEIVARQATIRSAAFNNRQGLLQARDSLTLTTDSQGVDNSDTLENGGIRSAGAIVIRGGAVNNNAGLIAAGILDASVTAWDNQNGQTGTDRWLRLTSASLDNRLGLFSAGSERLELTIADALNNQQGVLQSASALAVDGGSLNNAGGTLLAADGAATLRLTGMLDNQSGRIAARQGISLQSRALDNRQGTLTTPGGSLTVSATDVVNNQDGVMESSLNLALTAESLDNSRGRLLAAGGDATLQLTGALSNASGRLTAANLLTVDSGALNNRAGLISGENLVFRTAAVDNSTGLIQANRALDLDTGGGALVNAETSSSSTGLRAGETLRLRSGEVDNHKGLIAAGSLDARADGWNNRQGQINALDNLSLEGQSLDNTGGQLQAAGSMDVELNGGQLINQQGLMLANKTLNLASGLLNNQSGTLQGNQMLALRATQVDNRSGNLLSGGSLTLNAASLDNRLGRLFALTRGEAILSGNLNNQQGFIKANDALTLNAAAIDNQQTRSQSKGIEAGSLTLKAGTLNNQNGALRAAMRLAADIRAALDNRSGLISSQQGLEVKGAQLALQNQGGDLVSQDSAAVQADSVTGVGHIAAERALTLTTNQSLVQDGSLASNGDITLNAKGGLTNRGEITALGLLALTAPRLENTVDGEINGNQTRIRVDELLNTGLLDGGENWITAGQLHNTGTGRIYGDRLLIDARTLVNDKDAASGKAAVIAGRQQVTLAVGTLENRDRAMIYSDGDMAIGGALSQDGALSGLAAKVQNLSADIEAMGALSLSATQIENRDIHLLLSDEPVLVWVSDEVDEFQYCEGDGDGACFGGDGKRYKLGPWEGDVRYAINEDGSKNLGVFLGKETSKRIRFFLNGLVSKHYYEYKYKTYVYETQVVSHDAAVLRSGKGMTLTGDTLTNQDSKIVAGGTLAVQVANPDNQETQGVRRIEEIGDAISYYKGGGDWKTRERWDVYDGNNRQEALGMGLMTIQQQAGQGAGQSVAGRDQNGARVDADAVENGVAPGGQAAGSGTVSINGSSVSGAGELQESRPGGITDIPINLPGTDSELVARSVAPDTELPDNSLFAVHPGSDSRWLVETDSRFTDGKKWLSSQDIWGDQLHKRLGDGYYEQRLVRDQLMQATGSRFLPGMNDDNEQYKWLLNNGKAFAEKYGLAPGVALSQEQMALLTSDMVWMVNQTVTLPDGSQEVVSVPQLYVRVKAGDLSGGGALLSGNQVQLVSRGDVTNSGTISGREMTQISADNLTNQGFVQGKSVTVLTDNDIINSGGTLLARDSLTLQAGHDIISRTEGGSAGTEAWLDRSAGIYVQNDKGELTLKAMNDITLTASELINRGQESTTQIIAGRDLNLDTQRLSHATDYTRDSKRYDRTLSTQEAGSRIDAGGVLAIAAGRDINARAAEISAGDALTAQAGRDINLTSGEATYDHEGRSKWTSSGFLSKTKHELYGNTSQREAQSTTVSGDSVQMQAGRDLTVQGSNVVGTGDVSLAAGNNLTLTTVEEAQHDTLVKQKKKSGLMSTGGIGFTVGSLSQKVSTESDSNIQKGSTVGSSAGNVSLSAGNLASVHGSDVVAGQDISITGRDVAITAAQNSHTELTKTETKSSGLTLGLSGSVGSALNTATQQARAAGKEDDDGRLAALKGTQAALTGYQAAQAGRLAAVSDDKKDGNTVGVMLSYGSQKSTSESRLEQRTSSGSTLTAGRDMTIRATGDASGQGGDLVVQGSQLTAGRDMALAANRDISLSSGQNSDQLSGSNKSSGGSVGVGIAVGSGSAGFTVSASVNQSQGREKGNGLTHTETTVDAGRQVNISSGRDTLLQGAQVSGESIKAEVGRNLTMRSEQDSDRYDMKQSSSSAGASVTWGEGASGSASVSASRDKMHSNFDSVQEQTGLFAGKGGFDVTVGEHTQLDGAVIASTASPENNRLDTGTLGWSDIHNQADYKVEHQSAGLSTGGSVGDQFLGNAASSLLVGMNGEGHDSSTTHAAVSDGAITIRDKDKQAQDVAGLSRDTDHAANGLSPIFDKEKEQQRLQEAQLIGEIGRQVGDIATTEGTIAGMKAKKDPAALAEAKAQLEREGKPFSDKDVAERAYNNAMQQFGTGSALQQGIQAATAAVQGLAGGDLSKALAGASAPYIANVIAKTIPEENGAGRLMAHAVVGAALALAKGDNALSGAAGAATGEAAGMLALNIYGRDVKDLSESEKQTISTLATLAAGLAGGLAGGSTADAVAGAQAGKNSAENNAMSLPSGMMNYGQAVASWNQYAEENNLTPEQKQAGLNKLAKGDLPEGANITKVIVNGYKDGVLISGAAYLGPAASVSKVVGGAVIAEIANGTYQWYDLSKPGNENKTWDYWGSVSAGITGALAPGRDIWQNAGIAAGGTLFTDGPDKGALAGTGAGWAFGTVVGVVAPPVFSPVLGSGSVPAGDIIGTIGGEFISNAVKDEINGTKK
ncbi:filamentous hemagglutinin N-terminal domain-containing protein [Jejubacter calystegiae]|uniref:Filamentous hemagglutinin N-terminal domain-containing protein n=1 Tax=Jejubacter calystegiae TaxID=2579935 RepID=A0A4P8YJU5_9ENTR|nr:hemagglutinin repeat-containing protein [Jejubacter calystegiae]QCT20226.1 filamentous hemagglutinin N-terminal domain-containing protein [Jejubacter calystegiae]